MAQQDSFFSKYKIDNEMELDKIVCRFYAAGHCPDEKCIFPHVDDENKTPDTACRYFLKGKCNYGRRCTLDHVGVVKRHGLEVLKISESQINDKRLLMESIELAKRMLSSSQERNVEQTSSLTESSLKTQSNLHNLEERQQNQFHTSRLAAKDLEIHKTEQNPPPRFRSPKKKIGITKLSRRALPPSPERQPCLQRPLRNALPAKTGDYKNRMPTQVFKKEIANDQSNGYRSWRNSQAAAKKEIANDQSIGYRSGRNSQAAATHKFSENLLFDDDDYNLSRSEELQNLMASLNEEHQCYLQSNNQQDISPIVHPKASSSKRKQLVSQQIMENVAKQKGKTENTFGDCFQNLPFGYDVEAEDRESFQYLTERCANVLKSCFGRDDDVMPSASNIPSLQGRKSFHENFNLLEQSNSFSPPCLRSPEIAQSGRQISSNLLQPAEAGYRVQNVNLEDLQDRDENYEHKWSRRSNSKTVQSSASNTSAQRDQIYHEDFNFAAQSSARVPLYLRSPERSEPSKKNSSVAKKKTDAKAENQNVVTAQPTTQISYRRSFKPRKHHGN